MERNSVSSQNQVGYYYGDVQCIKVQYKIGSHPKSKGTD